jgi:hypothetical protein
MDVAAKQALILGAGFGGVYTALGLEKTVARDPGFGLSEAMSPESGEEFGEKNCSLCWRPGADVELASVRDSLVEAVTAFSGGPILTEDCTLMVAEVR